MRAPVPVRSLHGLTALGRTRLSKYFFARNFLNSEIGNFHRIPNLVDDRALFIEVGTRLCTDLLDPMVETFGPLEIRSAHRAPEVNHFGNVNGLGCARNDSNHAHHIWDRRDSAGLAGACVSVVVPWFADQYDRGRDWRDLAWWVHDHLPYHSMWFFPKLAAFNLTWHERPIRKISSYIAPRGTLLAAGASPAEPLAARQQRYADFPPFRGIAYPALPDQPDCRIPGEGGGCRAPALLSGKQGPASHRGRPPILDASRKKDCNAYPDDPDRRSADLADRLVLPHPRPAGGDAARGAGR